MELVAALLLGFFPMMTSTNHGIVFAGESV